MNDFCLKLTETDEEKEFLYKTRTHPKIDFMLLGNPPKDMEQHLNFLDKVLLISRWIYIAYYQTKRVGYSQIYDVQDNSLEVGFVIHPDYQGKGLGINLVLETVEIAKKEFKNKKVILYVLKDNKKAIHIYKKIGFIEESVEKNIVKMCF